VPQIPSRLELFNYVPHAWTDEHIHAATESRPAPGATGASDAAATARRTISGMAAVALAEAAGSVASASTSTSAPVPRAADFWGVARAEG
jgi:hypothetical protein